MARELTNAARGIGPLIQSQRTETERGRRLPPEVTDALVRSKLCRVGLDDASGGLAVDPLDWLGALEVLAGFEVSVPWIAWNNGLVCMFSRFLSAEARSELFADPGWIYAQSTRPTGRAALDGDTYRVSGRWSLVSGCELAEWLMLFCQVEAPAAEEPEARFCFVHKDSVEILDTWDVGGLRGTGSHDVVVADVAVPRRHSLSPADGSNVPGPGGRVPIIANVAAGFAAQMLGVAQAALDTIVEAGRTRVGAGPPPDLRDRPAAQAEVARGSAGLRAVRTRLHGALGDLWASTEADAATVHARIGDVMSASHLANDTARGIVEAMYALGGTSSLYTSSPLERAHRDMHAMLRHIVAQPLWIEDAGRILFGLEPENPLFSV